MLTGQDWDPTQNLTNTPQKICGRLTASGFRKCKKPPGETFTEPPFLNLTARCLRFA
jgi:hypothetical protein